jgi:hypothetical protein
MKFWMKYCSDFWNLISLKLFLINKINVKYFILINFFIKIFQEKKIKIFYARHESGLMYQSSI